MRNPDTLGNKLCILSFHPEVKNTQFGLKLKTVLQHQHVLMKTDLRGIKPYLDLKDAVNVKNALKLCSYWK